jgi:hypothetical protein
MPAEAEVLFNLNDTTSAARNPPSWSDLFVKAIAGSLMVEAGYMPLPREVALARSAWLDEKPESEPQGTRRQGRLASSPPVDGRPRLT